MNALKIIEADYIPNLKVRIRFFDDTEKIVDFEPFLTHRPHQSFTYYRKLENFKKFKIEYGNLAWGKNWDIILPVEQLHEGRIEF